MCYKGISLFSSMLSLNFACILVKNGNFNEIIEQMIFQKSDGKLLINKKSIKNEACEEKH